VEIRWGGRREKGGLKCVAVGVAVEARLWAARGEISPNHNPLIERFTYLVADQTKLPGSDQSN
jgi:hypothetical protein